MNDRSRRTTLDHLGCAIVAGFEAATGQDYEYGLPGTFSDERIRNRRLPIRVVKIAFESGLADCMFVVTSVKEERAIAATASAAHQIADQLRVQVHATDPDPHEFDDHDEAYEQLEAMYDEPCLEFTSPGGDMLVIFGSGLVETATQLIASSGSGTADFGPRLAEQTDSAPQPLAPGAGVAPSVAGGVTGVGGVGAPLVAVGDPVNAEVDAMFTSEPVVPRPLTPLSSPQGSSPPGVIHVGDERWSGLISEVEVDVSAELGRTQLRLGDFDALTPDSVLTLDQSVDEPVTVFVNGAPYATARLIVVDGLYGIEIVEVLTPEAVQFV